MEKPQFVTVNSVCTSSSFPLFNAAFSSTTGTLAPFSNGTDTTSESLSMLETVTAAVPRTSTQRASRPGVQSLPSTESHGRRGLTIHRSVTEA
ncbi:MULTISPECIES: hypothetical protein [unclassified Akkermansia]|uniref:hypothetical protein n=1 Tax=unclassified Akkermansia TaxID=2608915 RepID=UPI00082C6A6E|nr:MULTISPECIES: hypothetical protein [unclassified Akkermansia]